jgi:uncharacterized protein (DUF1800 family)
MHFVMSSVAAGLLASTLCFAQGQTQAVSARTANRFLEQATWGPNVSDAEFIQSQGLDAWFLAQLSAPVSTYSDQPSVNSAGKPNSNVGPTQIEFFQDALNGPDQLRQRVAFALSEIWVVSNLELRNASAFPPLLNIFQNRALDNYENLMKDVTLSPAMGRFLNMVNNDKASAVKGTAANENYARELMQLFTLGLYQLQMDGTPVLDANGNSIPTYTQSDVTNLARVFTGWTYAAPSGTTSKAHNPIYYLSPMIPVAADHDATSKTVLGAAFPAGATAEQDLTQAIHTVFMQPSLPPFVSKQLIQHLVTSNPSPAYVNRVSQIFVDDTQGVRGDLKAVIYAILTDQEARAADDSDAAQAPSAGHLREPVLFVANLLRGLNGSLSDTTAVANTATNLGQQLFYAPSVFSYFSPQYRTAGGLSGPEFQIYSTQTAANRANTVYSAIYGGQLDAGTKFDLTSYISAAADSDALLNLINTTFFHQDMSMNLAQSINQALAPLKLPADKAKAALYVALTSGEYQIIH